MYNYNDEARWKQLSQLIDNILDCVEIDYEHPVVTELGVAFTIDREKSRANMSIKGIIRTDDI